MSAVSETIHPKKTITASMLNVTSCYNLLIFCEQETVLSDHK